VVTYGPSLAGLAGLDSLIGYEGERVLGMQQAYADINAALFGAFAIQIGLYHRERYGEGQHIEVAQLEALLSTMPEPVIEASLNKRILGTLGNVHPIMPVHNNYPCQGDDKWVSIAVLTDAEWKGFCKAIGNPPWTQKEDFAASDKRSLNRKELDKLISGWTADKTPNEVMEILQKAGVAATPCADTEERYFDPHFQEREVIVNVEHPVTGVDFVPKVVCNLSETPGEIRRPAPLLGEHNNYVFGKLLGLSQEEIKTLVEKEVIY
jgi:benzylsuccinate CoA-transferase BbsF subunit